MLADRYQPSHPADMFVVTEAEAAAIRTAFEQRGELSKPAGTSSKPIGCRRSPAPLGWSSPPIASQWNRKPRNAIGARPGL
jgi:hypothetical protein